MSKPKCIYRMHRMGTIKPSESTSNQCKDVGHPEYLYEVILVFPPGAALDANGFLMDHYDIDKAIQESYIAGSCEEMHPSILEAVIRGFMEKNAVLPIAYRCTLKPGPNALAFMEYTWVLKNKYYQYLT